MTSSFSIFVPYATLAGDPYILIWKSIFPRSLILRGRRRPAPPNLKASIGGSKCFRSSRQALSVWSGSRTHRCEAGSPRDAYIHTPLQHAMPHPIPYIHTPWTLTPIYYNPLKSAILCLCRRCTTFYGKIHKAESTRVELRWSSVTPTLSRCAFSAPPDAGRIMADLQALSQPCTPAISALMRAERSHATVDSV